MRSRARRKPQPLDGRFQQLFAFGGNRAVFADVLGRHLTSWHKAFFRRGNARTITDLEGAGSLAPKHLSEAIQYRTLDRTYRA